MGETLIINLVGYLATVVGALIMFPQIIKSLKTKKVNDISKSMLIIFLINCALWFV